MPVLMIGTYNEDGSVDVMNAAWGMMLDMDKVVLNLTETHKTVENIKREGYFTVALADLAHMKEADYVGIVSANNTPDKFEKSGLHAVKSENINAPIIEEFPLCMECKFIEYQDSETGCGVVAEVLNVSVDEDILDDNDNVDPSRLRALVYDPFNHGYYVVGEKVGNAFKEGSSLK
ncbi:MAG: flavin reductase [Bacilli bacterium]|nr:flavin reductase [Bacilli bacterium]